MNKILKNNRKSLIARFFVVLILGITISGQLFAATGLQKNISIKVKDASIITVLEEIQKQSGYSFMYNRQELAKFPKITLNDTNITVENLLNKIFTNSGFEYIVSNKNISIKEKTVKPVVNSGKDGTIQPPPSKKITINGKVLGEDKTPVIGATILILGTDHGTITDDKGEFVLTPIEGEELEVSFVGMVTYKHKVRSADSNLIINMLSDAMAVDDVVVTGIYTRKSDSFTGSSATFKATELKNVGGQNLLQSLKSLDPSFTIIENKNYGSDPNALPDMEIRGKSSIIGLKEEFGTDPNQPLFILDGFETDAKTVVNLNMSRIESVTILKDAASTAIYGSKAANGVVVIETKKAEKGKFRITYNGDIFISTTDLSDYNLMNASEKLKFETEAGRYKASSIDSAKDQLLLDHLYNKRKAEIARGVDTYWMNEPLRTAITHKHNLYADGGGDNIYYGMGATYNKTQGVMKNSGNSIFGFNFDLTYRVSKFQVSNKMSAEYNTQEDPIVSFRDYAQANPYYRKYNEHGEAEKYLEYSDDLGPDYRETNPLYLAGLNSFKEKRRTKFENKLNAEYKIFPELVLRGRLALGVTALKTDNFTSPQHPDYEKSVYDQKGAYESGVGNDLYYDGDLTLTYGKLFGDKHQINAVLGARMRSDESDTEINISTGFPIGDFTRPTYSSAYKVGTKPNYNKYITRSNSFYFNGGYSYANRYLLDANIRLDGASVFGTNKRYSETWAVGLGWNIHNEKFMQQVRFVNRLKIRASMGNPGNQNFSSFQSYTTYAFNNWIQNPFGPSMIVANFGNPDLEWQKTVDKNIGLDLTMMNNRLNVTVDYFNKLTDPLLARISVPASVGTQTVLTNMGGQLSQGISGTIKYSPIYRIHDGINWNLSLNFKAQKAEYRNIGNSLDQFNKENENKSLERYYNGGSPTSLWAVRSLGINPADGFETFLTKDGRYTYDYNKADEVIVGNSEPKLTGVLGSTLYYKGFSVTVYLRYSLGADVFNSVVYNKVENISKSDLRHNQDKRALYDRWHQAGDRANFKSISLKETTPMSSRFVLKENFLSGESFSVGYDFSSEMIKKAGMQALRLQANMNDIFRISSIKEERGLEYPFARTVSFSLSVTF